MADGIVRKRWCSCIIATSVARQTPGANESVSLLHCHIYTINQNTSFSLSVSSFSLSVRTGGTIAQQAQRRNRPSDTHVSDRLTTTAVGLDIIRASCIRKQNTRSKQPLQAESARIHALLCTRAVGERKLGQGVCRKEVPATAVVRAHNAPTSEVLTAAYQARE